MKPIFLFLCILLITIVCIKAARILAVFPTPSISHQVVFRPLTQELAKRGHEIVIITTDPAYSKGQVPANITEIDVHNLSYSRWNQHIAPKDGETRDWLKQMEIILTLVQDIFENQMESEDVQTLLAEKKNYFDLLLLESFAKPALGLSHVFKVPVIQISSFFSMPHDMCAIGAPSHPILYPSLIRDRFYNLTIWEKIMQVLREIKFRILLYHLEIRDNKILKNIFVKDVPTLKSLYNNIEMVFLNIHPMWENNRPVPSNVIYLGGLHQFPESELPKDLKLLLDASENEVIYFSLGTNVKPSLLPSEKLTVIMNVLGQLPYTILMKWDDEEIQPRSTNVIVSKWFPQADILKHSKVKLFITQGGLQSTDEAITAGVPLIVLPMLCDQWYNAEKYLFYQIGLRLDIQTLTEEVFKEAIESVIHDKCYSENIVKLRELIQDQINKPLERAVWWIEHLLRHGSVRHLRTPVANMSWVEYLELKLILLLLLLALSSVFILIIVVKLLVNFRNIRIRMKYKTV